MGSDLNIWSSHKLRFNSFAEGIKKFEKQTSKKIKQWNYRTDEPLIKTKNISEVEYFTHFDLLSHNFDNWNQITIRTNFEFCDELTLLRQTFRIHPTKFRTRYSKWQELVTNEFKTENEEELTKMKLSRNNWKEFRKYAYEITKILNGDKIIYLNDHRFQNEEDLFYQGLSLNEVIKKISKIVEPCELELLELFPNDIRAKSTWHYDAI